jgi:hypothetical protein
LYFSACPVLSRTIPIPRGSYRSANSLFISTPRLGPARMPWRRGRRPPGACGLHKSRGSPPPGVSGRLPAGIPPLSRGRSPVLTAWRRRPAARRRSGSCACRWLSGSESDVSTHTTCAAAAAETAEADCVDAPVLRKEEGERPSSMTGAARRRRRRAAA